MSQSLMQHQRELDNAAEIEVCMEIIEQEVREELLDGGYYDLHYRGNNRVPKRDVYDRSNVISAMIDLDSDSFDAAVMMSGKDPLQCAKALSELMEKAVNHVIGQANIRAAAEYEMEQEKAA